MITPSFTSFFNICSTTVCLKSCIKLSNALNARLLVFPGKSNLGETVWTGPLKCFNVRRIYFVRVERNMNFQVHIFKKFLPGRCLQNLYLMKMRNFWRLGDWSAVFILIPLFYFKLCFLMVTKIVLWTVSRFLTYSVCHWPLMLHLRLLNRLILRKEF